MAGCVAAGIGRLRLFRSPAHEKSPDFRHERHLCRQHSPTTPPGWPSSKNTEVPWHPLILRRHYAPEAPGRFAAQVIGFVSIEPESGRVAVRLADARGQVHDGLVVPAGQKLVGKRAAQRTRLRLAMQSGLHGVGGIEVIPLPALFGVEITHPAVQRAQFVERRLRQRRLGGGLQVLDGEPLDVRGRNGRGHAWMPQHELERQLGQRAGVRGNAAASGRGSRRPAGAASLPCSIG